MLFLGVIIRNLLFHFTYIPDGEPHIFEDRIYLFGSHDRFGGDGYCQEPYASWSAPITNLNEWNYEGECGILLFYSKFQYITISFINKKLENLLQKL